MSEIPRRVSRFFDKSSGQFDAIYTDERRVMRSINRIFRRDIYDRFEITMQECTPASDRTVLDVGCGSGQYAVTLARRGALVTGVDLSPRMVEIASRTARAAGVADRVDLVVGDLMHLVPRRRFTYVIALGVFDYLEDASAALRHLARFAERKVVVSFPKRWFPRSQWRSFRYGLQNCPVYFYTEQQVIALGATIGSRAQRVEAIPGPGYDYVLCLEF